MDRLGDKIWDLVDRSTQNARRHNVAALLYRLKPAEVTEQDQEAFAKVFRQTLAQNLLFFEVTRGVLEAFRKERITVMPLKGILFASRCYENIGVRPQTDVDVLVRDDDLDRAHRLLIEQGSFYIFVAQSKRLGRRGQHQITALTLAASGFVAVGGVTLLGPYPESTFAKRSLDQRMQTQFIVMIQTVDGLFLIFCRGFTL